MIHNMPIWGKFVSKFIKQIDHSTITKVRIISHPIPMGAGMLKYEIEYTYTTSSGHQNINNFTVSDIDDVNTFLDNLNTNCNVVQTKSNNE